ncbi:MucBP domain-containing protein [Lactobacillus sp. YT155]|uniref:MucBP domain-containing protein n=1 Tax=Lactobacillus sp. YT155 TaxID=3060955 RepID=UPI00265FE889|nr:MucBP domain-containing protein [Lactobacillus sp. YT155]MDO1605328.1 MucBP domain-containing protein [Lactobacillus sp. YT155]
MKNKLKKATYAVLTTSLLTTSTASTVFATSKNNDNQTLLSQTDSKLNSIKSTKDQTFDWQGLKITLDSSGTLHIPGGTLDGSNALSISFDIGENNADLVKRINIEGKLILNKNAERMFGSFHNLESIDGLANLDTSKVVNMKNMFAYNGSLKSLDVKNLNTANVTSMTGMFYFDDSLVNLDLSGFNTTNVQSMESMFERDESLSVLNLESFNTENTTDMLRTFSLDRKLRVLVLGKKFKFDIESDLNEISGNEDEYTGKWQNVGTGTQSSPDGKNVWTSSELIQNYNGATDADTYVWQPKEVIPTTSEVNVKYQTAFGETLASTQIISGNIGESYDATNLQKDIEGYHLVFLPDNVKGVFSNTNSDVIFVYEKDEVKPVEGGNITVKYVDEAGNSIADDVIKSGNIGEKYTTEQKDITGYSFKEVKGNAVGQFTDEEQTVTYIYTADKSSVTPPDKGHNDDNSDKTNDNSKPNSNHKSDNSVKTKLPKTGETTYAAGLQIAGLGVLSLVTGVNFLQKKRSE